MKRWPSAKVPGGGRGFIGRSPVRKVTQKSAQERSLLTDSVRQPAVEERLIGRAALGEAKVTLALEGFERAQEDGFAVGSLLVAPTQANRRRRAANLEEGVQRGERRRPDASVGHQVGIVAAIAVERSESTLEEGDRHRRPHVGA